MRKFLIGALVFCAVLSLSFVFALPASADVLDYSGQARIWNNQLDFSYLNIPNGGAVTYNVSFRSQVNGTIYYQSAYVAIRCDDGNYRMQYKTSGGSLLTVFDVSFSNERSRYIWFDDNQPTGSALIDNSDFIAFVTNNSVPATSNYTVSLSTTNGTTTMTDSINSSTSSLSVRVGSNVTLSVTTASGYSVPSSITIASGRYGSVSNQGNGVFVIHGVLSNLSISVSCLETPVEYISVDIESALNDCSVSYAQNQAVGSTFSGSIVPASGFNYPNTISGHCAGIPLAISYNSSNGTFTIANCPTPITLYATAVSQSTTIPIVYDLTNCTCSISASSVPAGTVMQFYITPNSGNLMVDSETSVTYTSLEVNYSPQGSYSYAYYFPTSFSSSPSIIITGVARPWQSVLSDAYNSGFTSGSGSGSYSGSYLDGYNAGIVDGVNAVDNFSRLEIGQQRYNDIYSVGYRQGVDDVALGSDSDNIYAITVYNDIIQNAYVDNVLSVNANAPAGSLALAQFDSIFASGVTSVNENAPENSLASSQFETVYSLGFNAGRIFGESEDVDAALVSFIPSVIASVGGFFVYVTNHIGIFGVTLASIIALLVISAIAIWVFKLFKGTL